MNCQFCHAPFPDKYSPEARSWEWFTGRLPQTVCICPDCRRRYTEAVERLKRRAGLLPAEKPA